MKKLLLFSSFLMALFLVSCDDEVEVENEFSNLRKINYTDGPFISPLDDSSPCDDFIGSPQAGPTEGCQSSKCPGYLTISITDWNCPTQDCYVYFFKVNPDYGPAGGSPYTQFPCTVEGGDICIDEPGTYTYKVDLTQYPINLGDPYDHEYRVNAYMGDWPTNVNNSCTISWSGSANGSVAVNYQTPIFSIFPAGDCVE